MDVDAQFQHLFSAESVRAKRHWISSKTSGQYLFTDIFDLTRSWAHCDVHGKSVNVDDIFRDSTDPVRQFLAGFSCKTMSALGTMIDPEVRRGAIDKFIGTTGETLFAVILFLLRRQPMTFVLENVTGLLTNDQRLLLITKF